LIMETVVEPLKGEHGIVEALKTLTLMTTSRFVEKPLKNREIVTYIRFPTSG